MYGKLVIFSAPSGSGKTTIVKNLINKIPDLGFSISCCTREKRQGEIDGNDYYFLTKDVFESNSVSNRFGEWEEVYKGNYYGTLKEEVERLWSLGKTVIFDVDVVGGLNLKKYYKDKALAIYVKVSDVEVIKERLRKRGTEDEDSLQRRVDKMLEEMRFMEQFDVKLNNDILDESLLNAEKLVTDFIQS